MEPTDYFLKPSKKPVIPELAPLESTLAGDQPRYASLQVLRGTSEESYCMSRWSLTPAQRKLIAEGADLFLVLATFGKPAMPVQLVIGHEIDAQSAADVYGFTIPDKALPKEK